MFVCNNMKIVLYTAKYKVLLLPQSGIYVTLLKPQGLHSSGMLCGVGWWLVTDALEQTLGPVFMRQTDETSRLSQYVGTQLSTYATQHPRRVKALKGCHNA